MKITINAVNPTLLLSSTLSMLAVNFGGFADGDNFLDLFDDMLYGETEEERANGLDAVKALMANIEGATRVFSHLGLQENEIVETTNEDEDAGIDFVEATKTDFERMSSKGPIKPGEMFKFDTRDPLAFLRGLVAEDGVKSATPFANVFDIPKAGGFQDRVIEPKIDTTMSPLERMIGLSILDDPATVATLEHIFGPTVVDELRRQYQPERGRSAA